MSWPTLKIALRLRVASTATAAGGLIAVLLAVGALFPAIGHTFGTLNIPKGVADLLGGADYGTITGWFRSEIGSVYGPLLVAARRDHGRRRHHGRRGGGPDPRVDRLRTR